MAIITLLLFMTLPANPLPSADVVAGSWKIENKDGSTQVLLIRDSYFSVTHYNAASRQFFHTLGGTIHVQDGKADLVIEFDTKDKEFIGTRHALKFESSDNRLNFQVGNYGGEWTRVDDGQAPLAGNWRISGRLQDGQMSAIPKRDRKTLKLLTGNRFQWMAINPVTKEFFGTGGGTYTFVDGRYTETIEFFSRDSSRVGASLQFDGRVEGDNWHHSGKSSRGEDLNEVWSREK